MIRSRPIEIGGRFMGVAIAQSSEAAPGGWRFLATDPLAQGAEGEGYEDLAALRRRVQSAMIGALPARGAAPRRAA